MSTKRSNRAVSMPPNKIQDRLDKKYKFFTVRCNGVSAVILAKNSAQAIGLFEIFTRKRRSCDCEIISVSNDIPNYFLMYVGRRGGIPRVNQFSAAL